jgi:hypothetical protein
MTLKHTSHETEEIQEGGRFTTKFSADRVVRIGIWKAAGIVFTTFVAGFGGSLFVRFNTAISLPGRVDAIEEDVISIEQSIKDLKGSFMPLDMSTEKWKNNDRTHEEILKRLDLIQGVLMTLK